MFPPLKCSRDEDDHMYVSNPRDPSKPKTIDLQESLVVLILSHTANRLLCQCSCEFLCSAKLPSFFRKFGYLSETWFDLARCSVKRFFSNNTFSLSAPLHSCFFPVAAFFSAKIQSVNLFLFDSIEKQEVKDRCLILDKDNTYAVGQIYTCIRCDDCLPSLNLSTNLFPRLQHLHARVFPEVTGDVLYPF
ncbi:hypothetical protein GEMRC1_000957 [Eukaryota sp. GEM-RC1]